MPQPPQIVNFLNRLRDLHGSLRHHGNYCGSFEGALMEAQGLALIASSGTAFDHRNSLREFANSLNNGLGPLDRICEGFRTRDPLAGSLLINGIGPFVELCRRRLTLAQQTDQLAGRLAASHVERERLAGCPARTRERGAPGTVQQWLEAIRARHGWTPPAGTGTQILSTVMMADADAQSVLARIATVPATAAEAAEETRAAAELSRELVSRNEHHTASEEYSGYAAALRRLWTDHGMLVE